MDLKPVLLPELSAKAYGTWATRMRRALPPSPKPGRIPSIVAGMLDQIASQAGAARSRGERITPRVSVPLGIVDGIVRQLQRLIALTPRKEASSDMEEVGWLIELALRRAARGLTTQVQTSIIDSVTSIPPEEAPAAEISVVESPDAASEISVVETPEAAPEISVVETPEAAPEVSVVDVPPVEEPELEVPPVEEPELEFPPVEEPEPVVEDEPQVVVEPPTREQAAVADEERPVWASEATADGRVEELPAATIEEGAPVPIRVLLVDDEPRTLAMLGVGLRGEHDIEVIGLASDVAEAVAIARTAQPDVAVVDVRMPRGGGPRAARGILSLSHETRILAYSALDERRAVLSMLESGAIGYLVKGGPPEEVAAAIRKAMRGERPLSGEVAGEVMEALTERVRLEADDRDSRDQLERQVRRFLSGRDLRMAWQPIVRLATRDVVGAEALPRFQGGIKRTPEAWFREAWRLGFGPELEISVLETASARLERLPEELFVAVNLSPGCLVHEGFLATVQHLPWKRLVIEVTERSSVDDYARLRAAVREIRRRGGRLAVDDAGAAFASLRHVAEIEPDVVKVDERVARNIHMDPRMHALATALISFSRELGAEIVAEGIEHRGQLEALRDIGVEYGQGPIFGGVTDSEEVQVRTPRKLRGRR